MASEPNGSEESKRGAERQEHELIVDMEEQHQDSGSLNQAVAIGKKTWLQDFLNAVREEDKQHDPNRCISIEL